LGTCRREEWDRQSQCKRQLRQARDIRKPHNYLL
jgi:hypothetical protein